MTLAEYPHAISPPRVVPSSDIGSAAPLAAPPSGLSGTAVAIFALAVVALFACNMLHAYGLGFQNRMYDSPIYRWRESLVIALSRMQPEPLHGYVGYRSILNYLTQHGLALIAGEAQPLPTAAQLAALVADGAQMDRLMQGAAQVAVDPKLPPVILQGNELGEVDYMYWAFKLYGININALVLFYFTLLFVSVTLFFITFRRAPFCLLLLMLYLAAHYFALDYAQTRAIIAMQNSRFFPVLGLLPALYLILLAARRVPPSIPIVAMAAMQTFILIFMVFCRTQTFWEVLAIPLVAVAVTTLRPLRTALFRPRQWPQAFGRTAVETWPAILAILGSVALVVYGQVAPDEHVYSKESKAHLFWADFFVGTISSDPGLYAIYGYRYPPFSDDMGYVAAIHDLRGRNAGSSPIVTENDGVLDLDVWKSNGAYGDEMHRLYLRVVQEHPWFILRSFLVGKPLAQVDFLRITPELWRWHSYIYPALLALAATLLALVLGAPAPTTRAALSGVLVAVAIFICSTITSFVFPTALIAEAITTWLIFIMLCVFYVPLSLLFARWRRRHPVLAAS